MENVKYKTRGQSTPNGKPKVFFCCHPGDFALLSEIASDILQSQDCAIWYTTDPAAVRDSDYLAQLRQMQLLVAPVTSQFLREPNDARNIDFQIARESGIPILPLMQEVGIESEFNTYCGQLQFLSKHDHSPGALPFRQKLEQFLSSVLIGPALANRIRSAFSGYIFLSYRKKDRIHAQKLMELIHVDQALQDIAIWYDEFLTPGENFNINIHEALYRSDLFVLAVTPNLICETNYVMTTEYPMAIGIGKTVVPVELVPTDKRELAAKYPGISECFDPCNPLTLIHTLKKNLPIRSATLSPGHRYLIGLAYRSGIDVEVNHVRALELLRSSADDGFSPATQTLADMYRSGTGVPQSASNSILWQKKLILQLENDNRNTPSKEKLLSLVNAILQYGEDLEALSYHKEAYAQCTTALKLLTDGANTGLIGHTQPDDLTAFYKCYFALGSLSKLFGQVDQAKTFFEKALFYEVNLSLTLPGTTPNRHLLNVYHQLVGCASAKGDWVAAEQFAKTATQVASNNVKLDPSWESRMDIALTAVTQGAIREHQGALEYAQLLYKHAYTIFSNLDNETENSNIRYRRILACRSLSQIYIKQRKYTESLEYSKKALELAKELYHRIKNFTTTTALAESYYDLGNCLSAAEEHTEAKNAYQNAITLLDTVAHKSSTVHATKILILTHMSMVNLLLKQLDYSGAVEHARCWMSTAEKLYAQTKNPSHESYIHSAASKLSAIRKISGMRSTNESEILQALSAAVDRYNKSKTNTSLHGVYRACVDVGIFYSKKGIISKEKHYYSQAAVLGQTLLKSETANSFCRDLFDVCKRLGELCLTEGSPDQALQYWKVCVLTEQILCDRFREAKSDVFYTDSLRRLANAHLMLAKVPSPERNRFRDKAIEIYELIRVRAPANTKDKELLERLKQGFYE